ncbi:ATP-binding protein [Pirellulaceae bacterium SH467]
MWIPNVPNWTIRKKLLVSMVVLGLVIAVLGYSSFRGVYAYRDLAATLGERALEMPMTAALTRSIDALRNQDRTIDIKEPMKFRLDREYEREMRSLQFQKGLEHVRSVLSRYRARLESSDEDELFLADRSQELALVAEISELIQEIDSQQRSVLRENLDAPSVQHLQEQLAKLSNLAHELPMLLAEKMSSFREDVRDRYRTWIVLTWSSALLAGVMLIGLISYARRAVIRPFKELLAGARRVAAGDFTIRIGADSKDELAELADAINLGVASFLSIQRDLHEQVRERSREVIRNEQLASVGFLAAGVAHEINNPLASIAWSAEALESRLHRILHATSGQSQPDESTGVDVDTLKTYLRRIQDEAFRCKGITERLLDFSRLGTEERRQYVDLAELIEDVVGMVRHLGQFRSKKIEFNPGPAAMMAWASPQEMKQVVLNLLTNALESLDPNRPDGLVTITIEQQNEQIEFAIQDNGSGMTEEVLQHLFEPFFTRRRDGRGTGLGLPITSRIIADHGGHIAAKSLGAGNGSRFEVRIPCQPSESKHTTSNHSPSSPRESRYAA